MSKDKYPSIFSTQMEAIVFITLKIFYATRAVLKIGEYLTIRLWARDFFEVIVDDAEGRINYRLVEIESE